METAQDLTTLSTAISPEKKRLIDVLTLIENVCKRDDPCATVEEHRGFVQWESDMRGLPGISFNLDIEGEPLWMEVKRLTPRLSPASTSLLEPWLVRSEEPNREPELRSEITVQVAWNASKQYAAKVAAGEDVSIEAVGLDPESLVEETIYLQQHPEIQEDFLNYKDNLWRPWAEAERSRRATIKIYSELFGLMRRMELESASDRTEIVWGMGIAVGALKGSKIRYPLLTASVYITIDERTNSLLIRPYSAPTVLESLNYEKLEVPGIKELISRFKEWSEKDRLPLSPFSPETFFDVTRTAAAQLSDRGVYWPDVNPDSDNRSLPVISDGFAITDSWVIFSRKKSTHYFLDDVRKLKEDVIRTEELLGGARAIVADPSDEQREEPRRNYRGVWGIIQSSFGVQTASATKPEELYFPKPYNSEQLDIIDRLNVADGVVVQGPPGTGKTHTIANIICHYLAHGKRVLVTSSGEAALKVLRDKLPAAIRELVVTRLHNDLEGSRQLERSIRQIAEEVESQSIEGLHKEINEAEERINQLHHQLDFYSAQMKEWAHSQTGCVPSDPEARTPIEIAQLVYAQRAIFGWFPDDLGVTPNFDPRFDRSDITTLREARLALGEDIRHLHEVLPSPQDLPTADTVVALHEELQVLAGLNQQSLSVHALGLASLEPATIEIAEQLLTTVTSLLDIVAAFNQGSESAKRVLFEVRSNHEGIIAKELLTIRAEALELEAQRVSRITSHVEIPDGAENDADIRTAVSKRAKGEKASGLLQRAFSSSLRQALTTLNDVRINTELVADTAGWSRVQDELVAFNRVRALTVRWNNIAAELELPKVSGVRFSALKALLAESTVVDQALQLSPSRETVIREMVAKVFAESPSANETLFEEPTLSKLRESLQLGLPHQRRGSLEHRRNDILDKFVDFHGTPVDNARRLLRETLGSLDTDSATVAAEWSSIVDILATRESQRPHVKTIRRVADIFEECGAITFAQQVRTHVVRDGCDTLLPDNLLEIWQLRRFATYLAEIDCHERLQTVMLDREKAEKRLAETYEELVRLRTWLELKRRLTPRVTASLHAFMSAIKSLGKGTGVRAARHRADASNAMNEAWEAIPCWIMSTLRVSEILPSRLGLFDLVIIDEASQSYIEALPALVRGKKILVVGDDEQISPTSFVGEADVSRYKEKYLRELPRNFQAQLSPGKSLYDFARVVFPTGQVTLKEHFRCVSAIIEFSNLLCYDGRIQCLRVPKPSERLDPPLIDVYIKGAYRQDKTNRAEAEAIVREIERIAKTPGMESRTIGIISLIGDEQAKLINDELMRRLGEEIIQRHDIVSGNAHTLQGNERDIVFLSMIVTPDDAHSDTSRPFKQRLNVAASRARDRMYLFRSVQREHLKDGDLKARLLDHFRAPLASEELEVLELRERCESGFELAVFDELVKRGYEATPQVSSSGYRIDIVVEGDNDARLAIECDGDQYHGPEQWAEDYKRQRILERAGWKFWRCWGSSFYRSPERCLEDLLAKLDQVGIRPRAVGATVRPSRFVESREVSASELFKSTEGDAVADASASEPGTIDTDVAHATSSTPSNEAEGDTQPVEARQRERGRVDLDELIEYIFEDAPESTHNLRVVELGTTNLSHGIVAAKGPLGTVLLGSRVGDTFEVQSEGGARLARITAIHDIDENAEPPLKASHGDQLTLALRPSTLPEGVTLHPYTPWRTRTLPDPRSAKRSDVLQGLEEIVAVEGPISCARAFSLYTKAAGYKRLGPEIKDALFRALQGGITTQRVVSVNELRRKDRLQNILSIPGQCTPLPRECGGRDFTEIPPSELKLLLEQVLAAKGGGGDRNSIHREIVRLMGGNRVAVTVREHLARVEEMLAQGELGVGS